LFGGFAPTARCTDRMWLVENRNCWPSASSPASSYDSPLFELFPPRFYTSTLITQDSKLQFWSRELLAILQLQIRNMSDTQSAAEAVSESPAKVVKLGDSANVKPESKTEASAEVSESSATNNAKSSDKDAVVDDATVAKSEELSPAQKETAQDSKETTDGDSKIDKIEDSSPEQKEKYRGDRENGTGHKNHYHKGDRGRGRGNKNGGGRNNNDKKAR
jgi:hypothetical protein